MSAGMIIPKDRNTQDHGTRGTRRDKSNSSRRQARPSSRTVVPSLFDYTTPEGREIAELARQQMEDYESDYAGSEFAEGYTPDCDEHGTPDDDIYPGSWMPTAQELGVPAPNRCLGTSPSIDCDPDRDPAEYALDGFLVRSR